MTGSPTDPPFLHDLIGKIARGDREAFARLYDVTAARLFGIALRILGRRELAEEALQESFVALWERAGDYSPDRGAPMAWLVTIVRHRAIDHLRRRSTQAEARKVPEEALLGIAAGGLYSADRSAELDALQRCLDELEGQPRRAVVLAYVYGLTHQELAANLGAPVGTVKSWIRRSVERLKQCLDG